MLNVSYFELGLPVFLHDPNSLSNCSPRSPYTDNSSYSDWSFTLLWFPIYCIVNHDLTLSSPLHVIQHFETICTNWYYHKPTRFRQPNNGKGKYPQQNQSSFAFAVKYLVLTWGILFLPWGFWFCREVFCFCPETLESKSRTVTRASIKSGTRNIPEHPGTSRNMKK